MVLFLACDIWCVEFVGHSCNLRSLCGYICSCYICRAFMSALVFVVYSRWIWCVQSLQALKKISQEHPTACLRAGALMAVLSYLDFFSTGVQVSNFISFDFMLVNRREFIFVFLDAYC